MKMAMVGLGRMGINMSRRLLRSGHRIVAYNRTPDKVEEIRHEGAEGAFSLESAVDQLDPPRVVWLMLPAGAVVDQHVDLLGGLLSPGDIVVDGGNSYYRDDVRRARSLTDRKIRYLDAGVSGGIWGLSVGYCTMVGGDRGAFEHIEPILKSLAPPDGYLYCGGTGAGHFVKMVHNGIEYGMMAAYSEGFEILKASPYAGELHLEEVSHLWNRGSVIRSWLLDLAEEAFREDPELASIRGWVEDSGEGRWTLQQAVETGVSAPVLAASLFQRFRSRQEDPFSNRVLAALRNKFGGHAVQRKGESGRAADAGAGSVRPASADPAAHPFE